MKARDVLTKTPKLGKFTKGVKRKVLIGVKKRPQKSGYKVPATPRVSGLGWGH